MSRNRGQRKPKIHDLSRTPPTYKETQEVIHAYAQSHPIVTAILGSTLVEHELDTLLRRRFLRNDDEMWRELTADNGPIQTFSQKICCGYAFKLYDESLRDDMDIIRVIRNQFAHARRLIQFDNPLIVQVLQKAKLKYRHQKEYDKLLKDPKNSQLAYAELCAYISLYLIRKSARATKAANARLRKKNQPSTLAKAIAGNSYVQGIMPFLQPLPKGPLGFGTLDRPASGTADPIPVAPQGWLGDAIARLSKNDDKKDT